MTKKSRTVYSLAGGVAMLVAIISVAFSFGATQQQFRGKLISLESSAKADKESTQNELNRFSEIIASQIGQVQSGIRELTSHIGELRTDVGVLKALMERIEKDLRDKSR